MATMDSYTIKCKIFVEKLTDFESLQAVSGFPTTGELQELPLWQTVSVSVSSGLNKSISITMANPLGFLANNIKDQMNARTGDYDSDNATRCGEYVQYIYDNHEKSITYINPLRQNKGVASKINDFLIADTIYGVVDPVQLSVLGLSESFMLTKMQRIWVVTETIGAGADKGNKYSIVAGIISDFSENHDSNGSAVLSISCTGLSRFLDLTPVHTQFYLNDPNDSILKDISENILKPVLLQAGNAWQDIIGSMSPLTAILYPVWLTNMMYTKRGYFNKYTVSDKEYTNIDRFKNSNMERFFYYEPIWQLGSETGTTFIPRREDVQTGTDEFSEWAASTRNVLFNRPQDVLRSCSIKFSKDHFAEKLINNKNHGVGVVDLIPAIYYDPLIMEFLKSDALFDIFDKRVRSGFELFNINTITASEMLQKVSTTIIGSVYEDDLGNITLEIPRYWDAPRKDEVFCTSKEYDAFFSTKKQLKINNGVHNDDYVLTGDNLKACGYGDSEANIVTSVNINAKPTFFQQNEIIENQYSTGRVSERLNTYIKFMQRRYGIRQLNAQPIYTTKFQYEDSNGETVRLKDMLDSVAETMLFLRNYSQRSGYVNTTLLHWIQTGKNFYHAEFGRLWMITNKQWSYDTNGSCSCTFTVGWGHLLNEIIEYPFLNTYINYKNATKLTTREAVDGEAKVEGTKQKIAVPNIEHQFDEIIFKYATQKKLDPDVIRAIIKQESSFDVHAKPKKQDGSLESSAEGLMQILDGTWKDYNPMNISEIYKEDPDANIDIGTNILFASAGQLYFYWLMVLAYHDGLGAVSRYVLGRPPASEAQSNQNIKDAKAYLSQLYYSNRFPKYDEITPRASAAGQNYIKKVSKNYAKYSGGKNLSYLRAVI